MIQLIRTSSEHPDFRELVTLLDADLSIRDGDDHAFYHQFNKIDKLRQVVIAFLDKKAVGCGAIKEIYDDAVEVKRMYVMPDQRGRGIASSVLLELERWAAELGYQRCVLETGIKQPEAIALYGKNNYTQIPNYGQYNGVATSVCFEKKLCDF